MAEYDEKPENINNRRVSCLPPDAPVDLTKQLHSRSVAGRTVSLTGCKISDLMRCSDFSLTRDVSATGH